MNQLTTTLQVLETQKPVVSFNYDAMKTELEKLTNDWKGFVIQENDLPFTKDLLAYLNKLKKSVDDFRKDTKKELSEPITTFEGQCKELVGIIDNVYSDIKGQYDTFEEKRKQEKLKKVNDMISFARSESGLPEKYQLRIESKPEYLNKTMTENKILDDIQKQIDHLKKEYEIEKIHQDQINTLCEMITLKQELTVALDPKNFYYLPAEEAKTAIEAAAERQKQAEQDAIDRKAKALAENLAKGIIEHNITSEQVEAVLEKVDKFIPIEPQEGEKQLSCTLKITATKSQMNALKAYMQEYGIKFERMA